VALGNCSSPFVKREQKREIKQDGRGEGAWEEGGNKHIRSREVGILKKTLAGGGGENLTGAVHIGKVRKKGIPDYGKTEGEMKKENPIV